MLKEAIQEYESEITLEDLPLDFHVKILDDVYTVGDLTDRDFKVKYNPDNELIFIFAHIKYQWSMDELYYRSIIVDADGSVLSSGFPKFFNFEESKYSKEIDKVIKQAIVNQSPNLIFTHKHDGTLIIRSVINGQVVMRTRGTFSGRGYGEAAKKVAAEKYPQLLSTDYCSDISLLFEYVSPNNKIVVSYDDDDLILLGAISHDDLSMLSWDSLVEIDSSLKLVETHSLTSKSLSEINDFIAKYPCLTEGIVVRYDSYLCKIKSDEYLRLHKLKFDLSYEKVVDVVKSNNIESWDELEVLLKEMEWDVEWFDDVKDFYGLYVTKQNLIKDIIEMGSTIIDILKDDSIEDLRTQKSDFVKKIACLSSHSKNVLFGVYDDKPNPFLLKKEHEIEYLQKVLSELLEFLNVVS